MSPFLRDNRSRRRRGYRPAASPAALLFLLLLVLGLIWLLSRIA